MINIVQPESVECQHRHKTLAQLLVAAREAAGLTQAQLAELVGVAQQTIHKLEAGITVRSSVLPQIEKALGVPTGYFDKDETLDVLPQPLISRCPILDWKDFINWPNNRSELLEKGVEQISDRSFLGKDCVALVVEDDTMMDIKSPTFPPGSIIIVDKNKKYKSGSYVIAHQENTDNLIFRFYEKIFTGAEHLYALKDSPFPKYQPIELISDLKIIGVVVASIFIVE